MTCVASASAASTSPRAKAVMGCSRFGPGRNESVPVHLERARLQRLERVGERLEHFVVDLDGRGRLACVKLGISNDHREEVGDAAGHFPLGDEHRLIGNRETDASGSRHVRGGEHPHDARHRRGSVGSNLQHPGTRVLRGHHRAVQHAGDAHVVHEWLFAERLLHPALTRDRMADPDREPVPSANAGSRLSPKSSPKN